MPVVSWHLQESPVFVMPCVSMSLPLPDCHFMLPRAGTLSPAQPLWTGGEEEVRRVSLWTFCWLLMLPVVPSEVPELCHLSLEDCPAGSGLSREGDSVVWGTGRWERWLQSSFLVLQPPPQRNLSRKLSNLFMREGDRSFICKYLECHWHLVQKVWQCYAI